VLSPLETTVWQCSRSWSVYTKTQCGSVLHFIVLRVCNVLSLSWAHRQFFLENHVWSYKLLLLLLLLLLFVLFWASRSRYSGLFQFRLNLKSCILLRHYSVRWTVCRPITRSMLTQDYTNSAKRGHNPSPEWNWNTWSQLLNNFSGLQFRIQCETVYPCRYLLGFVRKGVNRSEFEPGDPAVEIFKILSLRGQCRRHDLWIVQGEYIAVLNTVLATVSFLISVLNTEVLTG
jgi:hypothetical protein